MTTFSRKRKLPSISSGIDAIISNLQNVSFKHKQSNEFVKAIKDNDIGFASLYCFSHANPPSDKEVFFALGAHGKPQMYTLIRNSNCFEEEFNNFSVSMKSILDGIASTDNCALLHNLTQTHQLTTLCYNQAEAFVLAMRESCAYKCMAMFMHFILHHSCLSSGEKQALRTNCAIMLG